MVKAVAEGVVTMGRAGGHMQSVGYLNLGFGVVEVLVVTGYEVQLWKTLLKHNGEVYW